MKKYIILVLFGFESLLLASQSNIRLNNYWENTHFINPASTNSEYIAEISGVHQRQWISLPGAPNTFYGAFTYYNEKKRAQFGLNFFQDKIGYTTSQDVNVSYSYSVMLNYDWQLHFGIGVAYQALNYDISQMNLDDFNDAHAYSGLTRKNYFNANTGIELTSADWKFGIAGQHLYSLFTKSEDIFVNTNFLYALYRNHSSNSVDFGFGISGIQYAKLFQAELNIMSYFKKDKKDIFNVGLIYRSNLDIGGIFGINISDNFRVSYCGDYDILGIGQNTYGTHELMITYRFFKKICHCENN